MLAAQPFHAMPASLDLNRFAQLKATGHLPSPRGVAVAIMRMAQDETVSLVELARVIKGDPAFVGRLIKAANGLLVRQRAIVSVSEALMVVGLAAVRAMVLGFSLLSNYRKGNCLGFDYMRFWSSSIVMAIAMQTFATRTRQIAADEAFSVGLLARIGELALATVYPSKYAHVLADAAAKPGADLCELEQQTLALTHADLGGAMLADWGVPRVFNLPVRFYEHPAAAPVSNESREAAAMQCLSLSRIVADLCFAEPAAQADLMARAVRQAAQMGCPREALLVDCGEIAKQWKEWAKLLQLEATDTPPFEMLSVESTHKPETRHEISESAPSAPEVRSPTSSVSPLPVVSGLRAMVVERAGNERVRLAKALRGIGVDAHEFVDLGGVLEKVLDVQPHIMVLNGSDDPGHVGRLIKALRASRIGRSIYVLLLLSGDDEASIAVFESGADDYLVKPISS
ncbi:MAG: HDOD domain-containing protein, partial [Azoarcus sp.]|nr:HDOD domain-containing protein [Azoarcus sp.]